MTNQLQHQQRRTVDLRIPAIEKYAYCLCLHVKPTTIFIAVFKLIRALLFASMLLNSEFSGSDLSNDYIERHRSTRAAVEILSRIVMASVSAVGIYAVISGRAALLMPLYAILLVDLFFSLPAFYSRDLDPNYGRVFEDPSINSSGNQYARFSVLLFSTITMIIKIYFLCVIWKCYRYLRLIELVSPIRLTEIYPHIHPNGPHQYPVVRVLGSADSTDLATCNTMAPPPYESIASNMKPPNYEEAMKTSNQMSFSPTEPNQSNQQQQAVNLSDPNSEQRTHHSVSNNLPVARSTAEINNSAVPESSPPPFAQISVELALPQPKPQSQVQDSLRNSPILSNENSSVNNNIVTTNNNNKNTSNNLHPEDPVETSIDIPKIESNVNRDTH